MSEHEVAKTKAATTCNTAADYFEHPVSSFWHGFGHLKPSNALPYLVGISFGRLVIGFFNLDEHQRHAVDQ